MVHTHTHTHTHNGMDDDGGIEKQGAKCKRRIRRKVYQRVIYFSLNPPFMS